MEAPLFEIESNQIFSQSKIWQLNRDYYQFKGVSAFSSDIVPHHLTSNSFVGNAYAGMIFGLLRDLANKGISKETVYILELGAGHGRLTFHIIKHLEKLIASTGLQLPSFCYIVSDIVEENLEFFLTHPQFKPYIQRGILDVAYYDAMAGEEIRLRHANKTIRAQDLAQPIIAIANYFFDSIPNDLFLIKDKIISQSTVSINSTHNPTDLNPEELIKSITFTYQHLETSPSVYDNPLANSILESYKELVKDTYLFFPERGMHCLENLNNLSKNGMLLLTLDKGFHEIHDLENIKAPDIVTHGSFSIWVNFHALASYCQRLGGTPLFPSYSTFHLDLGALLFLPDSMTYTHTIDAYKRYVDDFGPDDFNSIKQLSYFNISRLTVKDILALMRLSAYDSTYFIKLLPTLKQASKSITFNERKRIAETMHRVWDMYFSIGESHDLPYEMAGIFYDLGFYTDALTYFKYSINLHGSKADSFYNIALCYYQLREDKQFFETIALGKKEFPAFEQFDSLEKLI